MLPFSSVDLSGCCMVSVFFLQLVKSIQQNKIGRRSIFFIAKCFHKQDIKNACDPKFLMEISYNIIRVKIASGEFHHRLNKFIPLQKIDTIMKTNPAEISVGVIGLGLMGCSIATCPVNCRA